MKKLLFAMLVAIVAGGLSGYIWGEAMTSVAWLGEMFLIALKRLIVPLVAASIIASVAGLGDVRKLARIIHEFCRALACPFARNESLVGRPYA